MMKNYKKFVNFFLIIYSLFSVYLIFCQVKRNITITAIFMFVLLFVFIIFNVFSNKLKKIGCNKKIVIVLITLSILIRLLLLCFNYSLKNVAPDYLTFYNNASNFSTGGEITSRYIAMFPYLFGYISVLANFFKIFGIGIKSCIFLNIILDLLGAFFAYKFVSNQYGKKRGVLTLLIWLMNPINIMWCCVPAPIIIVNTCIALCLWIFSGLLKQINSPIKITLIYSLILGIAIGISNSFRPIMIIFIIAVFIYYIYLVILNKKNLFKLLLSIIIIFASYIVCNNLNNIYVSNCIGLPAAKNASGWSVYIGSNYESGGLWFNEPKFNEFKNQDNFNAEEIHKYFLNLGINNYKKNGFSNIPLMFQKSVSLGSGIVNVTYNSAFNMFTSNSFIISKVIEIFMFLFWYGLLMLNGFSTYFYSEEEKSKSLIIILLIMGFFAATLFVEVAPRYFLPIMVPLTILASLNVKYLFNNNLYKDLL